MSHMVEVSDIPRRRVGVVPWDPYLAPLLVAGVILFDVFISVGSFMLAYYLYLGLPLFFWPSGRVLPIGVDPEFRPFWSLIMFVPFIRIATLWYCQLYRVQGEFSLHQDLIRVLKAAVTGSIILILMTFFYRGVFEFRDYSYSRMIFVLDGVLAVSGLLLLRLGLRLVQMVMRRKGKNIIPVVILGDGELAELCVQEITHTPRLGYQLIGVLSASENGKGRKKKRSNLPTIGTIQDLPALIRQHGIREVLITDDEMNPQTLFETIMKCGRTHRARYRVVPNLFNCLPQKTEIDQVGVLPMVKLFEEPLRGFNRYFKRGLDLAGACLLLLATGPLWLALALLIKCETRGPVFYQQERVGMDGQMFLMYKFRSMRTDIGDRIHREVMKKLIRGQDINSGTPEKPVYGKVRDDDRITRIGRWMRRYSLDELPQLLNVVRGEMSLVGPRPPIPYEVECYEAWHRARFHVKPGLTGLWQVSGRNRLRFDEMVRLDIFYIEHWSLWLDLKIMLKTPAVLLSDGTES